MRKSNLKLAYNSDCADEPRTVATHEPSPEEVSALRVGVNYRGGPSPQFVARGRRVDLESPTKFIPTVKGENDVVI